jgi:hypothetical protein
MKSKKANLKKEVKGPMKMKAGGYLEPDKELMFGGKSKYQAGGMTNMPMKPKKKMEMPASMQTPPKKKKPMGLMDKLENAMGKSKYKSGGFPDLNKDGKVTRADILKGRGVIKEAGGMMEECGPGRPCHNAKKAAKTARKQERNRRNPNASRRRAANAGNGGGGAGIGGAMKTIAGLGALGFMAKKAKDSM